MLLCRYTMLHRPHLFRALDTCLRRRVVLSERDRKASSGCYRHDNTREAFIVGVLSVFEGPRRSRLG